MTTQQYYLKKLGKNVQTARRAKGITIRKMGELCEADFSSLSRFENGRRNIHIMTLKTIADVLEMDLKELLPDY